MEVLGPTLPSFGSPTASGNLFQIPEEAMYCLGIGLGLLCLIVNVLVFRMTCHPELKNASYRVYLAFLAVVNTLALLSITTTLFFEHYQLLYSVITSSNFVCKLWLVYFTIVDDMCTVGVMLVAVDRFIASFLPHFKDTMCTCTSARLMCAAFSILICLADLPAASNFHLLEGQNTVVCHQVHPTVWFIYLEIIGTQHLPTLLLICLTGHGLFVFFRRRRAGSTPDEDQAPDGPLLALCAASLIELVPKCVFEGIAGYSIHQVDRGQDNPLLRAQGIISFATCVGLSLNMYLLLATSSFFRRCVRQTMQRNVKARYSEEAQVSEEPESLTSFRESSTGHCHSAGYRHV